MGQLKLKVFPSISKAATLPDLPQHTYLQLCIVHIIFLLTLSSSQLALTFIKYHICLAQTVHIVADICQIRLMFV